MINHQLRFFSLKKALSVTLAVGLAVPAGVIPSLAAEVKSASPDPVVFNGVEVADDLVTIKLNTAAQIIFACLVLASLGFRFDAGPVQALAMALVAVLTLLSVGFYVAEWVRHLNSAPAEH